ELSSLSPIQIDIYNTKGQIVRNLSTTELASGIHSLTWDGLDDQSAKLPTGVYLYRLTQGNFTQIRKMVLSK
ncbi:MAG TPA: FlgD immunoglobulin-like domain containing protein, partial [Candidatus Cloacimonadota bacterium]|nr:FlgD immunoglobulin-like domain containing protein [Candidatus Cloacimonadota bacterium]